MILTHFIVALLIALVLGAIFTLVIRARNPWNRYWALFLLLAFAGWVGGLWIAPFGPAIWGVYVMPFIFMAIIFGLLIAAASSESTDTSEPHTTVEEQRGVAGTQEALSIYFWILLAVLVASVLIRYLFFTV